MAIKNTATLTSNISYGGEKIQVSTSSNTNSVNNIDTDILVVKSAIKNYALPKDTITMTTLITNNTTSELANFKVTDTLSNGATFVDGSLKIGSQEYKDINPISGFTLPITVGVGAEMDIVYQIQIDESITETEVSNSSKLNIPLGEKSFEITSNILTLPVLLNEVYLLKTSDTTAVKSGDKIKYTITISNNGTLTNTDLFFQDKIPSGTTFVEQSVTIGDEQKPDFNPEVGFNLSDLGQSENIVVTFEVLVN